MWLRNDNNVARVKLKRIETSICSIIDIKLSTPIFGLPMLILASIKVNKWSELCNFRTIAYQYYAIFKITSQFAIFEALIRALYTQLADERTTPHLVSVVRDTMPYRGRQFSSDRRGTDFSRGMHCCATKQLTGLLSSSVTVFSYDLVVSHTKLWLTVLHLAF